MKFEYWQSEKDGRWYGHLIARNGKIVAVLAGGKSGGYARKRSLLHTWGRIDTYFSFGLVPIRERVK